MVDFSYLIGICGIYFMWLAFLSKQLERIHSLKKNHKRWYVTLTILVTVLAYGSLVLLYKLLYW